MCWDETITPKLDTPAAKQLINLSTVSLACLMTQE